MKKLLIAQVLVAVAMAPLSFAGWHEFTSADGSKKVWGEVKGYDANAGTVTLQLKGNRTINAPVTAFIEEDKAVIEKAAIALEAGRMLAVEFGDSEEKLSEKRNPTNGYQTVKLKSNFEMELRNNGQNVFKGLEAEYQIFYGAYVDPFKDRARTDLVKAGSVDIPEIAPRTEANIETAGVDMTRITRLPLSECKGGT